MTQLASTIPHGIPAKRLAIMSAALDIFVREGYGGASIDAIAADAGVSKQTVYNHFGDKQRLFLAVIAAARAGADEESLIDDSLLRSPADLERDLTIVGGRLLRVLLDEKISAVRRLLISEAARHPELDGGCGNTGTGGPAPRLVGWLTIRLACLAVDGVVSLADPERAAAQFVSLLAFPAQQLTNYGTTALSDAQLDDLTHSAVNMFLRAYRV